VYVRVCACVRVRVCACVCVCLLFLWARGTLHSDQAILPLRHRIRLWTRMRYYAPYPFQMWLWRGNILIFRPNTFPPAYRYLKLQMAEKALEDADQCLTMEPNHVKALFRRGLRCVPWPLCRIAALSARIVCCCWLLAAPVLLLMLLMLLLLPPMLPYVDFGGIGTYCSLMELQRYPEACKAFARTLELDPKNQAAKSSLHVASMKAAREAAGK